MKTTILDEAARATTGDRNDSYGHPLDDWDCAGRMIGAILDRWLKCHHPGILAEGRSVPDLPAEVATLLMQPVKISREVHRPKTDTRVDGAGYWNCTDNVVTERARRATSVQGFSLVHDRPASKGNGHTVTVDKEMDGLKRDAILTHLIAD